MIYLIVDAERMKVVAKVRGYKVACILPDLEHPKTPTIAFALEGKRTFSRFTELELLLLARNGGLDPNVLSSYATLTQVVFDMAEAMATDSRTYEELDRKAGAKVLPSDDIANVGKHKLPPLRPPAATPERPAGEGQSQPKAAAPIKPPRTKGATGRVWEVSDELVAEATAVEGLAPDIQSKTFRQAALKKCEEAGINAGTFGVQFGKWKTSKLS